MDSLRRPPVIAGLLIVLGMIVAMLIVGVPGCGGSEESAPTRQVPTSTNGDAPDVPQDANPGEGTLDVEEEEYGDTGPQGAGPLKMAAVSNTGAVVIYNLPQVRQIAYKTKTKDVSGVVSLTPAEVSPTVTESLQYMSARNPLARVNRTQKKSVQVLGAPGYEVTQQVGPPIASFGMTTIAKVKDQILSISVTGPIRKKDTTRALHRKLVQAVRVQGMSAADKEKAVANSTPEESDATSTEKSGGTSTSGGTSGGSSTGTSGESSGDDIPVPQAPTKTTTTPAKKDPARPVAGR